MSLLFLNSLLVSPIAKAFAIGETNKEFKNNKLNKLIDYSLLKNSIVNDLENNCQVYDFAISNLENLKFN